MVASSAKSQSSKAFESQSVGNAGYLNRHNTQMFQDGRSFSGNERDKLWIGNGGTSFADLSDLSGADSQNDGRAVLAADFDDDGDVDLFVHELQRERHALYRNDLDQNYGGFLKVRLRASTGHYEAIGATVLVEAAGRQTAQVLSRGNGYGSCQAPELVFGLGPKPKDQIAAVVRWPGGATERFLNLSPNSRVLLVEGKGKAETYEQKLRPLPDPLPAGLRLTVGQAVPAFQAVDLQGKETSVDLAKLSDGRPVYLNLWASYCVPCIKELPDLQAIHSSGDYTVIGLSLDAPKDYAKIDSILGKRGAQYPSFLASEGKEGESTGIEGLFDLERLPIPTTLVLSPEGVLQSIIRGPIEHK